MVKTKRLTLAAVLTAVILFMGFTPLGYIKYGAIEITTIPIPVAIGCAALGWRYGLYFGGLFGITSLIQAFMGSPFGQTCLSMSVILTIILCIVPRVLMGFLTGLAADAIRDKIHNSTAKNLIPIIAAPALNTVFFVAVFVLFFGNNPTMTKDFDSVFAMISALVTFNAVLEIIACVVLGTPICVALDDSGLLQEQ